MSELPLWDDQRWPALPSLGGDVSADVCVVGLGGSGLTCILELLDLGQRVVGIDAGTVGGGAAGRNGGFLLAGTADFYHDSVAALGRERARALYLRSMHELDRIANAVPEVVRRTGSLRIAGSNEEVADCAAQFAAMRADELPVEEYRGDEGEGLLIPTDGVFDPLKRCRILAQRAVQGGAQLFERSSATAIASGRVDTSSGSVRAERIIVAIDGGLTRLLPELGARIHDVRLQMLGTAPAPEVDFPRPVYRRWGYDYWQQLPDRRVVLGGLRDHFIASESTSDASPTPALQSRLEQLLREQLGVTAAVTHRWAGVVGYSASGLPVAEEVRPGVWAIGGYNGTGNVIGAMCGRGVAQLAVREDRSALDGLI